MRWLLWLSIFVLRRVLGMLMLVVLRAILGRGPAARGTLTTMRLLRRVTRL